MLSIDVARESATYACPKSKQLARSTSSESRVMPWLLWMEIAHASRRGSCVRCAACRPPLSMVHCSGTMTRA